MAAPPRPRDTSKVKSTVAQRPVDRTTVKNATRSDASGIPNREIIKKPKPKAAAAPATVPERKLIRKTPTKIRRPVVNVEHRLVADRRLVNGVVQTSFRCPCGKFHQDSIVDNRKIPRAEVIALYEQHLTL